MKGLDELIEELEVLKQKSIQELPDETPDDTKNRNYDEFMEYGEKLGEHFSDIEILSKEVADTVEPYLNERGVSGFAFGLYLVAKTWYDHNKESIEGRNITSMSDHLLNPNSEKFSLIAVISRAEENDYLQLRMDSLLCDGVEKKVRDKVARSLDDYAKVLDETETTEKDAEAVESLAKSLDRDLNIRGVDVAEEMRKEFWGGIFKDMSMYFPRQEAEDKIFVVDEQIRSAIKSEEMVELSNYLTGNEISVRTRDYYQKLSDLFNKYWLLSIPNACGYRNHDIVHEVQRRIWAIK